jgi:dGTPase
VNYRHEPDRKRIDQKKYGAFQSEKELLQRLQQHFQLASLSGDSIASVRHPLAYIVEAADDFCYLIMDLEDSVKLRIISYEEIKEYLMEIIIKGEIPLDECYLKTLTDVEQKIGYLRAKTIQSLISQTTEFYIENLQKIVTGKLISPLSKNIKSGPVLQEIEQLSVNRIYNYRPVLEIEAAGFEVLGGLLEIITDALLEKQNPRRKKIIELLPAGVAREESSRYERLLAINDYVSGMTDNFAISTYRKIKGISLPRVY